MSHIFLSCAQLQSKAKVEARVEPLRDRNRRVCGEYLGSPRTDDSHA